MTEADHARWTVEPATRERWSDLERLFGERGACGGCWCMHRRLPAACDLAAAHGARIVEGYPVEPEKKTMPPVFAFTGLASAFRRAGFREVERRSPTRPIMRLEL